MLKILLIWCLAFFAAPDHSFSQDTFRCYEFDLNNVSRTNEVCYVSTFKKLRKKHIITIQTDSIILRFGVLRTFSIHSRKDTDPYYGKGSLTGSQSFAVVLGQPDQLYVLREETRYIGFKTYYWFSVIPVQQNERMNRPPKGHVLLVSTEEICKL